MKRSTSLSDKKCPQNSSICLTFGFGTGLLLGAFLLGGHEVLTVCVAAVLATVGFHYTFSTELKELIAKVIKKGS